MENSIHRFMILVLLWLTLALGLLYLQDKYLVCPRYGNIIEKNVKYDFWGGGCFVEMDNGQWIDRFNYQGINIE